MTEADRHWQKPLELRFDDLPLGRCSIWDAKGYSLVMDVLIAAVNTDSISLSSHQRAVAKVWEKAIKVVRDMLPELEENYEAEKPMGFVGASYELGQAQDIITALEEAATEPNAAKENQ